MEEALVCEADVTKRDDAVKSVSTCLVLPLTCWRRSYSELVSHTGYLEILLQNTYLLLQVSQVRELIVKPRPRLFDASDPRHFDCLPMSPDVLATIMKNDLSLATQRYHAVPTNTKGLLMLGQHADRFYHFCLQPAERRLHVATDGTHPILSVRGGNSTAVLDFFHPAPAAKHVVLVRKQYAALEAAYKELECTLRCGESDDDDMCSKHNE